MKLYHFKLLGTFIVDFIFDPLWNFVDFESCFMFSLESALYFEYHFLLEFLLLESLQGSGV